MFCDVFYLFPSLTHLPSLCLWYLHLTVPFPSTVLYIHFLSFGSFIIVLQFYCRRFWSAVCAVYRVRCGWRLCSNVQEIFPPPSPTTHHTGKTPGQEGEVSRKPAKEDKKPEQIVCAWQLTAGGGGGVRWCMMARYHKVQMYLNHCSRPDPDADWIRNQVGHRIRIRMEIQVRFRAEKYCSPQKGKNEEISFWKVLCWDGASPGSWMSFVGVKEDSTPMHGSW